MLTFFDLPADQQASILTEWLRVQHVAELDTAVCNVQLRIGFLEILRYWCIFGAFDFKEDPMKWAVRNRLKFKESFLRNDHCQNPDVVDSFCPSLHTLQVSWSPPVDSDRHFLDPRPQHGSVAPVVAALLGKCSSLRELFLSDFDVGTTFSDFIQATPLLESVDLYSCTEIGEDILKACCYSESVTSIVICESSFTSTFSPVLDDVRSRDTITKLIFQSKLNGVDTARLCCAFANLIELRVGVRGPCSLLVQIATSCTHIQVAQIVCLTAVSDVEMSTVASSWRQLRWLWLSHFRHEVVCSERCTLLLLAACPALQQLKLCDEDPSPGDYTDEDDMPDLPKMAGRVPGPDVSAPLSSPLTHLLVESMTEHTLTTVLARCPSLHTMVIRHFLCDKPTNNDDYTAFNRPAELALHHLATSRVSKLHLSKCTRMTDAHIVSLCNLEELVICAAGSGLTSASIVRVVESCTNLHTVKLCTCYGLDHTVVLHILQKCPKLQYFYYYTQDDRWEPAVEPIADKVLNAMVKSLYPHLKKFELA